jgi:hypothetical protein
MFLRLNISRCRCKLGKVILRTVSDYKVLRLSLNHWPDSAQSSSIVQRERIEIQHVHLKVSTGLSFLSCLFVT